MGDDAELYTEMQELEDWDWVERYNDEYDDEDDDIDTYVEETEISKYFFVDYENVNRVGLNGIAKLSKEDCVRIYYSEAAETLTFGLHRRINASRAHIEYIKVQIPIKNAVDCQILFDIRDMIRENRDAEYFIVSKDTDFDKAIGECNAHNLKVRRVLEICKYHESAEMAQKKKVENKSTAKNTTKKTLAQSEEEKREAQVRTFFGKHFKKQLYIDHKEDIIEAVLTSQTRQQINNKLTKIYPGKTVSEIYKRLQPLIKDLPGK